MGVNIMKNAMLVEGGGVLLGEKKEKEAGVFFFSPASEFFMKKNIIN